MPVAEWELITQRVVRKAAGIYLCFALEQWVDHQQLRAVEDEKV